MKTNEIHIRDPFIFEENGKYYLYGSNGIHGFLVYCGIDLCNWSEPKQIFTPEADFWSDRDFWAPEMHKYNGKYYLFASFKSAERHRGTQLLVSDAPDGEFKPLTKYPITPSDWECLDGTLYIDRNQKPYLVFCHEWVQTCDGEICALALSDDLKTAISEPILLFRASEHSKVKCVDNKGSYVTDGPFLYRGDKLYMIWSSFGKNGYFEAVSVSDNGEIDGKWVHELPLLFEENGGHGMIFMTADKKMKFVLHRPNTNELERPQVFDFYEKNGQLYLR